MRKNTIICLFFAILLLAGCANPKENTTVSYESVESINAEASVEYNDGNYKEALTKYTDAININPIDVDAQLGAARCQIALENYDIAALNLSSALKIDPKVEEIYDVYLELSKASESIYYARYAVRIAEKNHVDSFLAKLPKEPVLSSEGGTFDSKVELTITADPDEEIFVEEEHNSEYSSYEYAGYPISITHGNTVLTAYCVKDGIPSRSVEVNFNCKYDPIEIVFKDPVIEMLVRDQLQLADDTPVTDIDCEKIKYLSSADIMVLKNWGDEEMPSITSVEDVKLFPNLQRAVISNAEGITDFSALSDCHKLNYLNLNGSGLTDISFLSGLTALKSLYLNSNEISDFSPLANMSLTYLNIELPENGDLSFLENSADTLNSLILFNCGSTDLDPVRSCSQLQILYLHGYSSFTSNVGEIKSLGDLHWLGELSNLRTLFLYGLDDFSVAEYLKEIPTLKTVTLRTTWHEGPPKEVVEELKTALPNLTIN